MKYILCALFSLVAVSQEAATSELSPEYRDYEYSIPNWDSRFQFAAGTAEDRCRLKNCLCRAGKPATASSAERREPSRRYSIYFGEGSHVSGRDDVSKARSWVSKFSQKSSITLIGYTDNCGTHDLNSRLVRRRVEFAERALKNLGYNNIKSVIFRAEASYGHDPASRRVDILVHGNRRTTTMIEKVHADVYLIDGSASMWSTWRKWSDVVGVSFKPGSRVYLSRTDQCYPGQPLDDIRPYGGTEIWYSYWKVIDLMKPGETLAIVSDFRSTVPLTRREASLIEEKVRAKNIKVIVIKP